MQGDKHVTDILKSPVLVEVNGYRTRLKLTQLDMTDPRLNGKSSCGDSCDSNETCKAAGSQQCRQHLFSEERKYVQREVLSLFDLLKRTEIVWT